MLSITSGSSTVGGPGLSTRGKRTDDDDDGGGAARRGESLSVSYHSNFGTDLNSKYVVRMNAVSLEIYVDNEKIICKHVLFCLSLDVVWAVGSFLHLYLVLL